MHQLTCDVAILGAGTAGLAAERHARKAGARTLLIDPQFAGTTCATVGCMPSKLLIAAAEVTHRARTASQFGVSCDVTVHDTAVMKHLRAMRDRFVSATKDAFEEIPPGICLTSRARFRSPNALQLTDGRTVTTGATVIATGATPRIPELFTKLTDLILTNESIFELDDLPASIGVIGAGPLGIELAQALSRLGVAVTVFDQGSKIAGISEPSISGDLQAVLGREFPIFLNAEVRAERCGEQVIIRRSRSGDQQTFDRLLVAAGRVPNVADLALEWAMLKTHDSGIPVFDPHTLQCGPAPVFIAGDANDDRPVLHEASAEGTIAGYNATHFPDIKRARRKLPMSIIFTNDPNVAVIGTPEAGDTRFVRGTASFRDQGRALVMKKNVGRCHLYADAKTGRLAAATLVGPDMEHLAHGIAWMIHQAATASDILNTPFYHPTIAEGLQDALGQICAAVGDQPPYDRDDGYIPGL